MTTLDEAAAFFRSRGHPAAKRPEWEANSLFVAARWVQVEGADGAGTIQALSHCFLLFPRELDWVVRDINGQINREDRFGSLPDAVNALLARLQAYLAAHPE